ITFVTTIRNRHSETVDKALVSRNSVSGPKFPPPPGACVLVHRLPYPPVGRGYLFAQGSDSLDYANRWRSPHAEPPSHRDRMSCSTRREISSPAKELGITFRTGIGIAYVTTIRNRHSETVESALVSRNSVSGPKFPPGACVLVHRLQYPPVGRGYLFARGSEPPARPQFRVGTSTRSVNGRIWRFPVRRPNSSLGARSQGADAIAYGHRFAQTSITFRSRLPRLCESLAEPTRGAAQSQRSEVVFNSTSRIWVPEHRRYSHPLRFIPTPSAKELGITFRTGIKITYVTTIRNRHYETVDKALVSRNSVPGPKSPPERVY
ncbi:hypothetical protein Taro_055609, partial [Colocasia esculenta]|nr:hypothetical protein [Colocasia esculenta]